MSNTLVLGLGCVCLMASSVASKIYEIVETLEKMEKRQGWFASAEKNLLLALPDHTKTKCAFSPSQCVFSHKLGSMTKQFNIASLEWAFSMALFEK